jgi:2-(1,2-epoxy-1,2-dihydrophenyl)acetyl-CoA isomerase|tara:strand:- start:29 stop:898 length:870 start_codon:yes stop_codon:yes gene_type:complete
LEESFISSLPVLKNNLIKINMNRTIKKELKDNGVLILTLNRPEVLNAMNKDLIMGLYEIFQEIEKEKDSRVIIITGEGRGFCSGADLANGGWPSEEGMTGGEIGANNMEIGFNPLIRLITSIDKPVITAINGMAAGGGVGLALSGDLVVASESAKFKLVFGPNLGIIPDVGASWFVPNLVGRARANGMGLLGDDIPAIQAKEWGLIWDYYPDNQFMEETLKIANRLADGAIKGLKAVSKAHNKALSGTLSEQLDHERDTQRVLLDSQEFKEGVGAFLSKRKPNFRDLDQ